MRVENDLLIFICQLNGANLNDIFSLKTLSTVAKQEVYINVCKVRS